jgi:hypothetical protein
MTSLESYCIYFSFFSPPFRRLCLRGNFYSVLYFLQAFTCNKKKRKGRRHDVSMNDVDHLLSRYCQVVKRLLLVFILYTSMS